MQTFKQGRNTIANKYPQNLEDVQSADLVKKPDQGIAKLPQNLSESEQ